MSGRKQFDVDVALEQAMRTFWDRGYADASVDVLTAATGLGRGSLYGTFGGKDALFRSALGRYSTIFGARFDDALAAHDGDPVAAVEAFFEVTLDRIADPDTPIGCLIAQSAIQAPMLSAESAALVRTLLDAQRARIRRLFGQQSPNGPDLGELTEFVVAVNQSLAVLSRAGASQDDLRGVVRVACRAVDSQLTEQESTR